VIDRRERRQKERRKSKRLYRHFVVAYRVYGVDSEYDLSQIKNISKGGLRFITSRKYPLDTILAVELRTPVSTDRIRLLGKVISSETVVEDLIYDTRIIYAKLNKETETLLDRTIKYFSNFQSRRSFWEDWDR
jgi:hypothetical protein